MELPSEVMDQIFSVEEDIRNAQNNIDRSRAQCPTDQKFQLDMDIAQTALDLRKKKLREAKTTISKLTAE